jgi:hypothetical protein
MRFVLLTRNHTLIGLAGRRQNLCRSVARALLGMAKETGGRNLAIQAVMLAAVEHKRRSRYPFFDFLSFSPFFLPG